MEKPVSFWTDESGQGLTGYAVIIALALVLLVLLVVAFGDEIARFFEPIKEDFRKRPGLG